MADDFAFTPGVGGTGAADEIGGVKYPRVKLGLGDDGTAVDLVGGAGVAGTNTLRNVAASDSPDVAANELTNNLLGALDSSKETDQDAASAALNGLIRGVLNYVKLSHTIHSAWDADTDPAVVVAPSDVITVSLTTGASLVAGDVMAATQEVANFFRVNGGKTTLQSVVAIDTDDAGVDFDLVFMNANTTLGTESSAPDIDDTEVLTVIGIVEGIGISSATSPLYSPFIDLGGCRVATRSGIVLPLEAGAATTSVWVAAITRGAPTYTSGVVTIKLGILQD